MNPSHTEKPAGPANPVRRLLPTVGRTPLLEVRFRYRDRDRRIFAKLESLNLTGSIKDRMAARILWEGYTQGVLRPGDTIVEASSGNTAISFAAMGRAIGHPVRIYMPDWMSTERKTILRSFGAQLVEVSAADGGFIGSVALACEEAATRNDVFVPMQFSSLANLRAHAEGTGPELLAQLASLDLEIDAFVAGVGTGGTVMGVGRALRAELPNVRIHPVEPAESPVLSMGCKTGAHRIQGISDEFVPDLVDLGELDAPIGVPDGDSILIAQALAGELGLGVGISSGANLIAAIRVLEELGGDAVVATVFPDSNKKYLSTDLFRDEPILDGYVAPELALDAWEAIPYAPSAVPTR